MIFFGESTFHNVGQGLFYSLQIWIENPSPVNVIYDCGSFNEMHLNTAIREFSELAGNTLHLLILSHLHYDHISGLETLLNSFEKKGIVILPYLYPIERLLLYFSPVFSGTSPPDWYVELLRNPAKFFKDRGFRTVFIIFGNDGTPPDEGYKPPKPYFPDGPIESPGDNISPLGEPGEEKKLVFIDKLLPLQEEAFFKNVEKFLRQKRINKKTLNRFLEILSNDLKNLNSNAILRLHFGFQTISKPCRNGLFLPIWNFSFFNYKKWDGFIRLLNNQRFRNLLENVNSLWELLEEPYLSDLRNIYLRIARNLRLGNRRGELFNNTSLVVLHSPYKEFIRDCIYVGCLAVIYPWLKYVYRYTRVVLKKIKPCCSYICTPIASGTLLTGDIDLNYNYMEFKNHFSSLLDYVGVSLIPHHGSQNNWNDSIIEDMHNCEFWIASAGCSNSYGHPHLKVFEDLLKANKYPIWCNECRPVNFLYELYNPEKENC